MVYPASGTESLNEAIVKAAYAWCLPQLLFTNVVPQIVRYLEPETVSVFVEGKVGCRTVNLLCH